MVVTAVDLLGTELYPLDGGFWRSVAWGFG